MADIDKAYKGEPLEPELYTGNDVSSEEAERLLTPELDEAKEYYTSVFGGLELDSIPLNDKNEGESVAKKFRYDFDSFNAEDIKKFVQTHCIKTSTFFDGVFGFLLAKFSGAEESLFSTVFNGRNKKLIHTCGMFVKTMPVYCDTRKNDTIADYLKSIDAQLDNNRKYDLYSYADICADLQIKPQVLFSYQGDMMQKVSFCGGEVIMDLVPSNDAKENILFEINRLHGKFIATVEYRTDLYTEESMRMLARCYEKTVTEFLTKQSLSEIDITDNELLSLLDSFNSTEREYEKTDTVTLFRRQAEQNPDNTAVVYLDKSYTYKEVDEISERIGAYISSLGIGREDVVSVLIPRC